MKNPAGIDHCPSWCVSTHLDDDTLHHSESISLELLQRSSPDTLRFRPGLEASPLTLELVTHREIDESQPWVAVLHAGSPLLDLTVESASLLSATLRRLADEASR